MTKEVYKSANLSRSINTISAGLPDVVFRDYDIRGYAGTEISVEFAQRLGTALGYILIQDKHPSVYVGRDCRLSSPELAKALVGGLISAGIDVIELGMVTTSALNYAVHRGGQADCGVMVTASHNPRDYNGFKIIVRGSVMAGETLQRIKSQMAQNSIFSASRGEVFYQSVTSNYLEAIAANCTVKPDFKLVVDAGNGAAGPLAIKLFESINCQVIPLNCEPNGTFPNHDPNPSDEKNLQQLIERVVATESDLGLAFDGDGDRLVAITGSGQIVWPDRLMMIFARDILQRHANATIVFDVKSSNCLDRLVRHYRGVPLMCKTGHAQVRKAVKQSAALLGGEFSGHIFFGDRWDGYDDGLYAAVRLLEILSDEGISGEPSHLRLEQSIANMEKSVYTPELLVPVSETEKFSLMRAITDNCSFEGANIITIDGLRVEYPSGWGLIRASNTSAYLTLRFEADSEQALESIKHIFRNTLSPFIKHLDQYL
jgi:phosphomannomutase/phosphoglucomutase